MVHYANNEFSSAQTMMTTSEDRGPGSEVGDETHEVEDNLGAFNHLAALEGNSALVIEETMGNCIRPGRRRGLCMSTSR